MGSTPRKIVIYNGCYGSVVVLKNIFDKLNPDFFISHSTDKIKYMCANDKETKHLKSLGIKINDEICFDWYKIILGGK